MPNFDTVETRKKRKIKANSYKPATPMYETILSDQKMSYLFISIQKG